MTNSNSVQPQQLFSLLLTQIDDVQVLNQHRDSNTSMTGVGVRSGNLRTTQYQGRSRSKTIGSILLMNKDNPDFSLDNIQDPVGLANILNKSMYPNIATIEKYSLKPQGKEWEI
jgi:hypothetical protein